MTTVRYPVTNEPPDEFQTPRSIPQRSAPLDASLPHRALGIHWQARTPTEREEFVLLFADLLERTYISQIDLFGGERIRFTGEQVEGDGAIVRAKVITRQGLEVPVEARLLRRAARWLVYDIAVEGISLIGNYRAQFDRIIRTSSYEDLVKRLRAKQAEFIQEHRRKGA